MHSTILLIQRADPTAHRIIQCEWYVSGVLMVECVWGHTMGGVARGRMRLLCGGGGHGRVCGGRLLRTISSIVRGNLWPCLAASLANQAPNGCISQFPVYKCCSSATHTHHST